MNFQRELALVNFPLLIVAGTDIVSVVRCIRSPLWNGASVKSPLFFFSLSLSSPGSNIANI